MAYGSTLLYQTTLKIILELSGQRDHQMQLSLCPLGGCAEWKFAPASHVHSQMFNQSAETAKPHFELQEKLEKLEKLEKQNSTEKSLSIDGIPNTAISL
jgi:hypothetical protein